MKNYSISVIGIFYVYSCSHGIVHVDIYLWRGSLMMQAMICDLHSPNYNLKQNSDILSIKYHVTNLDKTLITISNLILGKFVTKCHNMLFIWSSVEWYHHRRVCQQNIYMSLNNGYLRHWKLCVTFLAVLHVASKSKPQKVHIFHTKLPKNLKTNYAAVHVFHLSQGNEI